MKLRRAHRLLKLGRSHRLAEEGVSLQQHLVVKENVVDAYDSFFTQRFALETRGAFEAVEAMKFALEHQNPLVTGIVTGGRAYPEKSFSFLAISDPNVLLWALKPAEEGIGQGIIARVWNLASEKRSFSLSLSDGIARAWQTTHIETDLTRAAPSGGRLSASANPSQLMTFRLLTAAEAKSSRERATKASDTGTGVRR